MDLRHQKVCADVAKINVERLARRIRRCARQNAKAGYVSAWVTLHREKPWHSTPTKRAVKEVILPKLAQILGDSEMHIWVERPFYQTHIAFSW